jgi:hypothetical protein
MKNTNDTASPEVAQSWESSLKLLETAKRAQLQPVLAGFDGFVDTILHVVSERRSATEYSRVPTLQAFSEKVLAASGGRNMNIEMVPRLTKIGGNGPILANALAHFDIPVTYIGCLGSPVLHPIFDDLAKKIKTYSIAEPGFSDAIEFADGKLICGKQQAVSEISWKSVLNRVSTEELFELASHAGLIAFVNWGIVFSMTEIMEEFLQDIGNRLASSQKPFFIDTADPSRDLPKTLGALLKRYQN